MASCLSCSSTFLPTSSLSSSSSISSLSALKSKSCTAKFSSHLLKIVASQQQQQVGQVNFSPEGHHSHSGEMLLPVLRWSRREVLGLGAMLAAATGAGMAIVTPETNAATGECAELTQTPSGLAFCDTAVGSGITASKGLLIKAHYSGRLENGKVFDSSYNRGKPLVFRVGVGEVIRGWDQGILGTEGIPPMLAGGKRTLRIPANLGYGERGAGCRGGSCIIPPNSTLIFDVEFVGKA
ncbi:unnamed protein product [Calypogeia fissa]